LKKDGILNSDLSEVIASLGHKDMLVVSDAGFPIPRDVRRIDLAVRQGLPGFLEMIEAIADELEVEKIIIAEEMLEKSPQMKEDLDEIFDGAAFKAIAHAELKELSKEAAAVVRTGEFTPYANVILVSGVVF